MVRSVRRSSEGHKQRRAPDRIRRSGCGVLAIDAKEQEEALDDDAFNMSMRKFLKRVGVTSQQQIEEAMRAARDGGSLGNGPLNARVLLTVPELELEHVVEGEITLRDAE
jgi:hypothetical protein